VGLRFATRALPLVLTGCTVLSGLATLEGERRQADDPSQRSLDGPDASSPLASDASTGTVPKPPKSGNDANGDLDDPDGAPLEADAGTVTLTFTKTLVENQRELYGHFRAKGGTAVEATTTGSGDPDLYLRFNAAATDYDFDCESDRSGADERCRRRVPANGADVHLMVLAWDNCSYTLTLTYVPE
jgi:hypothetical protein